MKIKKQTFAIALTAFILFMLTTITTQSQIQFEGLCSEGEGGASWDADGTGPEPYGNGHENVFYYSATNDYLNNTSTSGGHMLDNINGFPLFEQSLLDNGFSAEEITVKIALCDLGNDVSGIDYFTIGDKHYANFYPVNCTFELNGEPLVEAIGDYSIYLHKPGYQGFESAYLKVNDISGNSSDPVKNVANALLSDIGTEEIKFDLDVTVASDLTGNGRSGAYFDLNFTFEKGLPTIPFQGLTADHEGAVAWDTDGTGPEPLRDGHQNYGYFGASRDYAGIDPDPNAAFGHFLNNNNGFNNFYLQMEYRGYTPDQIKIKAGICSLDEDIEGEDWFGQYNLNYYHCLINIELDDEPLIGFMLDTLYFELTTNVLTSPAIAYNASENSSPDIQLIADGFFKDLELRQLIMDFEMSYDSPFSGNGRDGAYYQVVVGNLIGKTSNCTRVYEGDVSGTWMASCSPYIIEESITVPDGETLTIEPGVWVKSRDNAKIDIKGRILAQGNDSNTGGIVFTAINPDAGWSGIEFFDTGTTNDSSLLINCIFEYGYGQGDLLGTNSGGAVAMKNFSKVKIDHCLFRYNWVDKSGYYPPSGGAIGLWSSSPIIKNSDFYNNDASYGGAMVLFLESNPTIDHCLFHHNTASADAGALIVHHNSNPDIINCTFIKNSAIGMGGAVDIYGFSDPDFVNCILLSNSAAQGKQISVSTSDCILDISYCDIGGGEAGIEPNGIGATGTYENNIDEDPAFADVLAFDYHLSNASPCVNTGDPSIFDPDGTVSDIGALYFSIPEPPVAVEAQNITNISFTAAWEVNYEVLGYILDVATDANFTDMVPDYDSLDVGLTYFHLVTVPEPGIPYYYRIRAYNAAGLSEVSNTILVLLTGMEENISENLSGLSIVPNPVSNYGNIIFALKDTSGVQIEIFNYTGQKVLCMQPEKQQKGQVSIPINFDILPSGTYVCRISTEKSVNTTKFIKH